MCKNRENIKYKVVPLTSPTVDLYELCTTIISDEKLAQLQTQKSCSSNKAAFCAAGEITVKRSAEIQTFVHPAKARFAQEGIFFALNLFA